MFSVSHLQDLVSLFHALPIRRAVWLNSTYKYPDVVSPHEPQTHTAILDERHFLYVWAVPERSKNHY